MPRTSFRNKWGKMTEPTFGPTQPVGKSSDKRDHREVPHYAKSIRKN